MNDILITSKMLKVLEGCYEKGDFTAIEQLARLTWQENIIQELTPEMREKGLIISINLRPVGSTASNTLSL